MALFNIGNIDVNTESKDDIRKVKSYLFQLNDQLRYMFANLDPEDNYTQGAYIRYMKDGERISNLEFSVDGIKTTVSEGNERMSRIEQNANSIVMRVQAGENRMSVIEQNANSITARVQDGASRISQLRIDVDGVNARVSGVDGRVSQLKINIDHILLSYAKKNEIVSSINLSQEGVKIRGNKIALEGTVTANNNLIIHQNGTIECNNGIFRGNITGSNITGNVMIDCGFGFWARDSNNNIGYDVGLGSFSARYQDGHHVFGSHDSQVYMNDIGNIYCNEIYLDDPWMQGWGLIATLKDIYNKISLKGGTGGGSDDGDIPPDGDVINDL